MNANPLKVGDYVSFYYAKLEKFDYNSVHSDAFVLSKKFQAVRKVIAVNGDCVTVRFKNAKMTMHHSSFMRLA